MFVELTNEISSLIFPVESILKPLNCLNPLKGNETFYRFTINENYCFVVSYNRKYINYCQYDHIIEMLNNIEFLKFINNNL